MDREIKLEPTIRAPREARGFVSRHLDELGYPKLIDDAAMIVCELVTNSVREAPGTPVWVNLRWAGAYPLLEVWDCSPDPPVFKDPDYLAEKGRGLHIVAELSLRLGWDVFPCGKVVWALLS
jgi:anti-sigma regulatory factor (Ser/Thr protein kinase)